MWCATQRRQLRETRHRDGSGPGETEPRKYGYTNEVLNPIDRRGPTVSESSIRRIWKNETKGSRRQAQERNWKRKEVKGGRKTGTGSGETKMQAGEEWGPSLDKGKKQEKLLVAETRWYPTREKLISTKAKEAKVGGGVGCR